MTILDVNPRSKKTDGCSGGGGTLQLIAPGLNSYESGFQECPENYVPYSGAGQSAVNNPGVQLLCVYYLPNIDVIAVTPSNNGTLTISVSGSPPTGDGAFSLATKNFGLGGTLTVSISHTSGLSAEICETNSNGSCAAAAGSTIKVAMATNATPTFSAFVGADGHIPASAGESVTVEFTYNGQNVGQTTVAVDTN